MSFSQRHLNDKEDSIYRVNIREKIFSFFFIASFLSVSISHVLYFSFSCLEIIEDSFLIIQTREIANGELILLILLRQKASFWASFAVSPRQIFYWARRKSHSRSYLASPKIHRDGNENYRKLSFSRRTILMSCWNRSIPLPPFSSPTGSTLRDGTQNDAQSKPEITVIY